ncbi:hypothetical protein [Curtobacterium oceanosedimentum]|uniref:hypothetical protein n=1 Tax=Curtobacterium oceanosedimentum TaxID=465820 RepID=UPI001CE09C8A|nr:hypothetical protein [Curtobacterium oceanosedimentum]MCA5924806.1 hypothetical protein [Curtobacterium oceanosedimentum]
MSALERVLLGAALAASPASHRAARREQWTADVRDARELDLSPTTLAFGALTTALFHRRAGHRSTWGNTMTTMPGSVRRSAHAVPTIPVLLALAVCSFLAASVGLGLLQRYNGFVGAVSVMQLVTIGLTVLPGTVVAACVLLVTGASLRRRMIGALAVLAVTALWWSLTTGLFNAPVHPALRLGTVAVAWLAVWLVVLRRPGPTWSLLLLPVVASVLVFPLGNAVWQTDLADSVSATVSCALGAVPFLVAVVGAVIAGRLSTEAPAVVEPHGAALVDKSA